MTGRVTRVSGPVVAAEGLDRVRLYNVVRVGPRRLIGEVIRLTGAHAVIQVYEETDGLRVGSTVVDTGEPLSVELGPGLVGGIFDGVQRRLRSLASAAGAVPGDSFLGRNVDVSALDRDRSWPLRYTVQVGDGVEQGDVVATVAETGAVEHRVLVPPGRGGVVTRLGASSARVEEPVVWIDDEPLAMLRRWPVRQRRPSARLLDPDVPLITGQRVVDTLFPVVRGGSATIPGGFGTGKTVHEQTLAKWSDADVVVYVGCGERGNEMAEVLEQFPRLTDPRTGSPLMERTILIANTSNMPVAAREASIYTAITIAEYYRDQGYDVALLADSTSRWGEALREVSSRLEEMPGEEGYPAYLASRLAEFYERAGATVTLGSEQRTGSVTIVGAVSPPGGDFSEPVTQYSLRLAGAFWALDADLARSRHFPAIHWIRSYTLYRAGEWFAREVAADWDEQREWALQLLGREQQLASIVQLLGADVLAPAERVTMLVGRMLREDFLQQSAFDAVDCYCPLDKQYWMLRVLRTIHRAFDEAAAADDDVEALARLDVVTDVGRMRSWPPSETEARARDLIDRVEAEVGAR